MPSKHTPTYPVCLLDAPVVCDVLALCHAAVDVLVHLLNFVVRVLVNDALCPLPVYIHIYSHTATMMVLYE